MSDTDKKKESTNSRRKLLKASAVGAGAVLAGKSLPEEWARPLVQSTTLPAHAQTSIISAGGSLMLSMVNVDDNLLDILVPTAHAEISNITAEVCCYLNPNGLIDVRALVLRAFNDPGQGCSGTDIAYFSGQAQQGVETELELINGECFLPAVAGISVMFSNGTASGDFFFGAGEPDFASPFNFSNPTCPFGPADIPDQCDQQDVICQQPQPM